MRKLFLLLPIALVLALVSQARALELEEIVKHINATAASIKDVQASVKVTEFDSIMEKTNVSARTLYFALPHLTRVDSFKTRNGKDVLTEQLIIGKDFILRVWPQTRHGELTKLTPEDIEKMTKDRNDPISFFGKNIDDIRKDFQLQQIDPPAGTPANSVVLVITPANKDVKFEYSSVEMIIDARTWLPRSIKSFVKGDIPPLDWTLYEFTALKLNSGLKPGTFEPPADIPIKTVDRTKPAK